jgi:hypothetical protein
MTLATSDMSDRSIRVRGTITKSEYVVNPPHPNPPRASFARLDPACGEREKSSHRASIAA